MPIPKLVVLLAGALTATAAPTASEQGGPIAVVRTPSGIVQAPLFSDQYEGLAVARIDDQVVTLRDLADLLGVTHMSHEGAPAPGARKDFGPALNRLITARLISAEAHEMGFEEQPLFQRELEAYARSHLVYMLQERVTAGVSADPADVERLYRSAVREWKVESVLFAKSEDAKQFAASVQKQKGSKAFSKLAARAIAAKKAEGTRKADWVSRKTAVQQVVLNLDRIEKVGGVTPPFRVANGWVVARVEDLRYPESAQARAAAKSEALLWAKKRALKKQYAKWVDAYVKADEVLATSLDFEAKEPGFEALEKDERVLARIEGAEPVTIKDLAQSLREIFFHSVEQAIEGKKVNAKKLQALDSLISKRLLGAEAARQHLADTDEHKIAIAEHRRNLLFTYYVDKAIAPDVKVTETDVRKYYDANQKEFTSSPFYTVASIAFRSAAGAQAAYEKLKAGADFKWMKANAPDQVAKADDAPPLEGTFIETTMTAELKSALSGAKSGDVRVYSTGSQHHVVWVKQVTPPQVQGFEEVRSDISAKLQQERMNEAIQAVADKLRKVRKVDVYITEITI